MLNYREHRYWYNEIKSDLIAFLQQCVNEERITKDDMSIELQMFEELCGEQ